MSKSHSLNENPGHPTEAYYSVDVLERDGTVGHLPTRARDAEHAQAIVREQIGGTGGEVQKAEFCRFDLRNRLRSGICKTYRGILLVDGSCHVYVAQPNFVSRYLNPRFDLANHSPDGFSWGYDGSGPAQLSLALLADALGDQERALSLYERFKEEHIARIPIDKEWMLGQSDVIAIAERVA